MRIKHIFYILVAVSLLFLAACSDDEEADAGGSEVEHDNLNEEGMPIVDDPLTIEVFSGQAASTAKDWNDVPVNNEYEDMSIVTMKNVMKGEVKKRLII